VRYSSAENTFVGPVTVTTHATLHVDARAHAANTLPVKKTDGIEVILNGAPQMMPAEVTVQTLLRELRFTPELVAVQVNDEIIPRSRHAGTVLADGDRIEVITFTAGG
jgi:sulfur carrier protein